MSQHNASNGTAYQNHYSGQDHQINAGSGTMNIYNGADLNDNTRSEILQALKTSPYAQRKDRNPDRVTGTCEWFMSHIDFHNWRDSRSSSMLWVSANPGCGKSVLAKYLVDELKTMDQRTTCYFFFKDDFEDQRSARSALSCILHQLFVQRETLFSEKIVRQFRSYKAPLANSYYELWELWDVLTMASQEGSSGEIICILDALDECKNQERQDLAKLLRKFYGPNGDMRKSSNLKFLITSRPYDTIRQGLIEPFNVQEFPVIHLKGDGSAEVEKIAGEISLYVKERISHIQAKFRLTGREEEVLLQGLVATPNKTYLWVYLTLDWIETEISNKINETEIRKIISTLPRTVDEAYDKILAKSINAEETKKLLHIVVAAERPLTLPEMDLALEIRQHHKSYKDLDHRPNDRVSKYIRDLCGLFINITDDKIYLLHQTAKEFLVPRENLDSQQSIPARREDSSQADQRHRLTWKFSLAPRESHRILCNICIWHLLFTEFEAHPLTERGEITDYLGKNVFLEYSAKSWAPHFRASDIEGNEVMESLQRICDAKSNRCLTWFKIYWADMQTEFPSDFTTIMVASYFGIDLMVQLQLGLPDVEIDSVDSTYQRSALSWAAENGFDGVVKLLVEGPEIHFITRLITKFTNLSFSNGANVNAKDKGGRTPLFYSAWNGHLAIVQRLVKAGASADSKDDIGGTPISYALCTGQQAIVDELMKGAQTDSVDAIRRELLLSAARRGHEPIVKLLLENGADTEVKDTTGKTLLIIAAEGGHKHVVRLLLEKGADIYASNSHGKTPLIIAAEGGHEHVVRLLLEKGADIYASNSHGKTPLIIAAEEGHEHIVRLLLEKGADANESNSHGKTPLIIAAEEGHEHVVRLLLEKGANANESGRHRNKVLLIAVERGHEHIVRLLLEKGADIYASNSHGKTPLIIAAEEGHEHVVRLLLEKGANANESGRHKNKVLPIAVERGHEHIVRLLLEKETDANESGWHSNKVLPIAVEQGHEHIVRLLLEKGADANASGWDEKTPLIYAIELNRADVTETLLKSGAKVNFTFKDSNWSMALNKTYPTPIALAIEKKDERMVELLLKHGALPNFKGGRDSTPLEDAMKYGNGKIVKMVESAIQSSKTGISTTA
ncbi:hypothetical protein TrVGV298_009825 [Trichoderma virens]|nr:hypothetical protein TrVGV298_009825 [Trichoderma virens]